VDIQQMVQRITYLIENASYASDIGALGTAKESLVEARMISDMLLNDVSTIRDNISFCLKQIEDGKEKSV
jgi:hypothetical protein